MREVAFNRHLLKFFWRHHLTGGRHKKNSRLRTYYLALSSKCESTRYPNWESFSTIWTALRGSSAIGLYEYLFLVIKVVNRSLGLARVAGVTI
jgi:hypothetical protein